MQPGAGFKRREISSFGHQFAYAESGAGNVIVSLPGSAGLEMSAAKDELARDYRVIEFDPPGWGETPGLAATMRQRHLATILGAAIDDLAIERFTLVGTSMGGTNALWLAQQMPERVKAIILEGSMAFCRVEDLVRPESDKMVAAIQEGLEYDDTAYPAPPPHPRKPWATPGFFHEQMRRRFKMMRYTDHPGEMDKLEAFTRTTMIPTTLLLGSEDEILKASYADHLKSKIANLRVRIIEGATHDIQNTAPEAFVDAVRSSS